MSRDIIRDRLYICLSNYDNYISLPEDDKLTIARKMERSCYNQTIEDCDNLGIDKKFSNQVFLQIYSMNTSRIIFNIDPSSAYDDYFPTNLDKFDLDKISSYSNAELNPNASSEERSEIELRSRQRVDVKVSRKYKCKRCGADETIVIEYQSRAVDEGSSYSIKCVKCENIQHK